MIEEKSRVPNRPAQYELVSSRGEIFGPYPSAAAAGRDAREKWPHRRQNEDGRSRGWDIQVVGAR